jgi:hypothetical protein
LVIDTLDSMGPSFFRFSGEYVRNDAEGDEEDKRPSSDSDNERDIHVLCPTSESSYA